MHEQFTAVYCQDDGWVMAYLAELPQVASQGKTVDEARENLIDAYQLLVSECPHLTPGEPPESRQEIARETLSLPSAVA